MFLFHCSIGSNGIIKKNKKKKVKSLAHKLSASSELTQVVGTAASTATTPLSPKNNKLKKKNKNKKDNSQKPSYSAANDLSSNTKQLQMKNGVVNSQKPPDNTMKTNNTRPPKETTLSDASSQVKKAKKKNQLNSQVSAGNINTNSASDSQKATGAVNKSKKGAKRRKAKEELPRTADSNKENEQRTIFVGNVSTKTTRKSLSRFFSKYGKVLVLAG